MTPDQRIELLCQKYGNDMRDDFRIIVRQAIAAAYEDAARIAEAHSGGFEGRSHGASIAAAIRNRARSKDARET